MRHRTTRRWFASVILIIAAAACVVLGSMTFKRMPAAAVPVAIASKAEPRTLSPVSHVASQHMSSLPSLAPNVAASPSAAAVTKTFTGENIKSSLDRLKHIGLTQRWKDMRHNRWDSLLASPVEKWQWSYEPISAVRDRFYECELGLHEGQCSRSQFCTKWCALASQYGHARGEPLLCRGEALYPRFSFVNPVRQPRSFVDFVHAMNRSSVRILLLGDSLAQQLARHIECHLARSTGVRLNASRVHRLRFTGAVDARDRNEKREYSVVRRSFVLPPPLNVSLELVSMKKNRVPFVHADILFHVCLQMDYVILLSGAHYEATNEHKDFRLQMRDAFELLTACARLRNNTVGLAFVTHAPHRFNTTNGWWQGRRQQPPHPWAPCVLLDDTTVEQADWVTPLLRRAAEQTGTLLRVPRAEGASPREAAAFDRVTVHYIPLFDLVFDVPGHNLYDTRISRTGRDCLHEAYFPDLVAGAIDFLFHSVASNMSAAQTDVASSLSLEKPDPAHVPQLLKNFAILDDMALFSHASMRNNTFEVATSEEFAQGIFHDFVLNVL